MERASVLPYRTDALALAEWLSARARGRSPEQLRSAGESPKAVEGTAAAAAALGFTDTTDGALSPLGERFALGDVEERRRLLKAVLLRYAPYGEMLTSLAERGAPPETEVRWIEAWWSTRGHGSSESNRREGAAAFGRLIDAAGMGEYIPGRRGRPTRIRWTGDAIAPAREGATANRRGADPTVDPPPDLFSTAPPPPAPAAAIQSSARPARRRTGAPVAEAAHSPPLPPPDVAMNRITVPLAGDALARIEVPLRLPAAEKRRLLDLLALLITEE